MHGVDSFVLSFSADITLIEPPGAPAILHLPEAQAPLTQASPGVLHVLRVLASDGATAESLLEIAAELDGSTGVRRVITLLEKFAQRGALCYTLVAPSGELATAVPLSPAYPGPAKAPEPATRYVLSRFAYLRRDGAHMVLESPRAHAKLYLYNEQAIALLHTWATPHSLTALCHQHAGFPPAAASLFCQLLLSCHALTRLGEDDALMEETPTFDHWQFHDLLFHARSRLGRRPPPYGATTRTIAPVDLLPAVKAPAAHTGIPLDTPDIQALETEDVPFTRVLEQRCSGRQYSESPITRSQLGEFLYRAARVKTISDAGPGVYERSNRPYPSGGACYELEVYPVIDVCHDLSSGLYHYCPKAHQLYRLTGRTPEVEALLAGAHQALDRRGRPQVLLVLAARFQRVTQAYDAMAYALILKHVGVLSQTFYLVATAMGLASCALGGGDSDLFCEAAGLDYYTETSVGEFVLGTPITPLP